MAISAKQKRSLDRFDTDLVKFSNTLGVSLEEVVKKVSFELFRKIISKTPVDTGRARVSWNINARQPDLAFEPPVKRKKGKSQARAQALNKIGGFSLPTPYSLVYITNNLPYIETLEDGSSSQSPRGMVRLSVIEVRNNMVKLVREATR